MNNKKLTILALIALALVVLAVLQSRIATRPPAADHAPQYLIQGLDPAEIATIVLGKGEDTITLKRQSGRFVIVEKDNYPAPNREINNTITACLDIQTAELYTDDPENHQDLGVTEEKAQIVVKFYRADSSLLTGLVIGDTKQTGKGTYVRLLNSNEVYVAPETTWIDNSAVNYAGEDLISIKRSDVDSITVTGPNDVYTLSRDPNSGIITLQDMPHGKKLKDREHERLFAALTSLRFEDVKKFSKQQQDLTFDRQFVCRLKDSTVYSLSIARADDRTYITCSAEFTDPQPVMKERAVETEDELRKKEAKLLTRDRAEDFSRKHDGWLYQIPEHKAKILTKDLSELLEDQIPPEEKAEEPETLEM
jgi:hypothetical protein